MTAPDVTEMTTEAWDALLVAAESMPPPRDERANGREHKGLPAASAIARNSNASEVAGGGDRNRIVVPSAEPLRLAESFLAARSDHLRRWRGDWFGFAGRYRHIPEEQLTAEAWTHLDRVYVQGAEGPQKIGASRTRVAEVLSALPSRDAVLLDNQIEPPAWVDGSRRGERETTLLPVANGILDLASGGIRSPTPALFAPNASPVSFDARATAPSWGNFLESLFGEDGEAAQLVQEWFGYVLTPDTRQQKILLLVGPKRSGKGTIARVLTALLGPENVAGPTLGSLAENFGLQGLLGRTLAIVSDARLGGRTDQSIVVERLLSISGEDTLTVDRKHRDPVHVRLPARLMLLTNELPRLADGSGALASRFLVVELSRSFLGAEDHDLGPRLLRELPGILNWAIAGWRRLRERGRFVQPSSGREAFEDLADLGSPIAAFLRDRCDMHPQAEVETAALFRAWCAWCEEQGRPHAGPLNLFARDLRAAVPNLRRTKPRDDEGRQIPHFRGVGLRG